MVYHAFEHIPGIEDKVIKFAGTCEGISEHSPRFLYVRDALRYKDLMFDLIERMMILEKSGLEKIFISPSYEKMKQKYWKEILMRLVKEEDVRLASETSQIETAEGESYEDCDSEAYEDESEGSDSGSSEETDRS